MENSIFTHHEPGNVGQVDPKVGYETRSVPAFIPEQAREAAKMFLGEGSGCLELRAIGNKAAKNWTHKSNEVGFFNNIDALVEAAQKWNGIKQIYIGANPRKIELLHAQPANVMVEGAEGAKAPDILCRSFFLIDIDTKRPSKLVAATSQEIQNARGVYESILLDLQNHGVTAIKAMSGNGRHLVVKTVPYGANQEIDDKDGKVALLLRYFQRVYGDVHADVDVGVFDLPRIWKLYGTAAIKGGNTVDRPWRIAKFEMPAVYPEGVDVLQAYRDEIEDQRSFDRIEGGGKNKAGYTAKNERVPDNENRLKKFTGDLSTLNIVSLFESQGRYKRDIGSGKHSVVCPWEDEHTTANGASDTVVFEPGQTKLPVFKCQHSHCSQRGILDVLNFFGPASVDQYCGKTFARDALVKKGEKEAAADAAEAFLYENNLMMVFWADDFYKWDGSKYVLLSNSDLGAEVMAWLQGRKQTRNNAGPKLVTAVVANLKGICHLSSEKQEPAWLDESVAKFQFISMRNGIVNITKLVAGEEEVLSPHTANFFNLQAMPYDYDPNAKCPEWIAFLETILPDPKVRALVQEWFGYNVCDGRRMEKFVLLEGKGANGKSVFCLVLRLVVGEDNVSAVGLEAFDPARTFPLGAMVGKTANIVEEMGEIERAAEGLLKQMVSGGMINIERKHRDPFNTIITVKFTFATNVLPRFADRSEGLWRRMILIPFKVQILDEAKQRREFANSEWWKGSGELAGIFNWAVEGYRRLMERNAFTEPEVCKAERAQYKLESNPTLVFLKDHYHEATECSVTTNTLYDAYKIWMEENGYRALNNNGFGREVRRAFPAVSLTNPITQVDGKRKREWEGLAVRTDSANKIIPEGQSSASR